MKDKNTSGCEGGRRTEESPEDTHESSPTPVLCPRDLSTLLSATAVGVYKLVSHRPARGTVDVRPLVPCLRVRRGAARGRGSGDRRRSGSLRLCRTGLE